MLRRRSVPVRPTTEHDVMAVLMRALDISANRRFCSHCARVGQLARQIAAKLGLDERAQELARLGGHLHDIGMLTTPPELLSKPGPLSPEERWIVLHHAIAGEMMLRGGGGRLDEIATVVRHHHERVDGTGYPDKLAGAQIPLASRIVAAAEALDTMLSDQPYRPAYPVKLARLRLVQAAGTQLDEQIVAALEQLLSDG